MALPGNTVLVHVESVQQVGIPATACRTVAATADGCVEVEGRFLCSWHAEFTLVLQLCAEERIVTQVHTRRLLAICTDEMTTCHSHISYIVVD
jgi:hypothetical protein